MRYVLIGSAAFAALALAACGGGEEEAPASGETAEVGAPAETPAETRTETPAGTPAETADPAPAAAEPAETAAAPSADAKAILASFGEPYTSADLGNGERLWRRCQSCHTLEEGARHMVGPNLHGMFGRAIGTAEGFRYSSALEEADFTWSPEQLEQWLANPRGFLPGNRMSFAGLRDADDRHDLIAWLAVETHAE